MIRWTISISFIHFGLMHLTRDCVCVSSIVVVHIFALAPRDIFDKCYPMGVVIIRLVWFGLVWPRPTVCLALCRFVYFDKLKLVSYIWQSIKHLQFFSDELCRLCVNQSWTESNGDSRGRINRYYVASDLNVESNRNTRLRNVLRKNAAGYLSF